MTDWIVVALVTVSTALALYSLVKYHLLVRAAGLPPGVNFQAILEERLRRTAHEPIPEQYDSRVTP